MRLRSARVDSSLLLLALMAALLIGGTAAVYFAIREDPMDAALSGDRIVNTLIAVEKDGAPFCAFVLMYYPETRRAALFDVPGELGQIIQSLGRVDRIDALYDGKRPKPYLAELSSVLGAEIPFLMAFEAADLSKLIDLMEGVKIFVSDPVASYDEKSRILLPAGDLLLDGTKALTYLTYGLEEEDETLPIARRQRFVSALLKRFGETAAFLESKPVRSFFHSLVRTNIDYRSFSRLFSAISQTDADRVAVQRIQGNRREVSGKTLLFPYYDGALIKDIVKQSLSSLARDSDGWSADRVYTVSVLNGTSNQGLAKRTADLLQGFGFDTVKISNAERTDYDSTLIISHTGDAKAARMLAEVIRCESISSEAVDPARSFDGEVDFTLIIGKDFNGRYVVR